MTTTDTASGNSTAVGTATNQSWGDTLKSFLHPRVVTMLFLGFSAGIPILLIFSSLSLWLTEAGVKKSAVTYSLVGKAARLDVAFAIRRHWCTRVDGDD